MLVLVDEEGVVLVVVDDVGNGREREVPYHVLALCGGVYVEVFATVLGEGERCVYLLWLIMSGRVGGNDDGER